jgi:excisionase family DNA binding protein
MERVAFSIEEAGEAAGVGRSFVFEEIRAGRLVAKKAGRRTLIAAADLMDWLKSLPTAATAAR